MRKIDKGLWCYVPFRCVVMRIVNKIAKWATTHGIPFYIDTWYAITDGWSIENLETMVPQFMEWKRGKEDDEVSTDEGMALYYWTPEEYKVDNEVVPVPHVIHQWSNMNRNDIIPLEIRARLEKGLVDWDNEVIHEKDFVNNVHCSGVTSWIDSKKNWWHYGEYHDNQFSMDC